MKEYIHLVDLEIRDIIQAINNLPFVEKTLYSCAGYGKQGDIITYADLPDSHGEIENEGYVVIMYKKKGWEEFHDELSSMAQKVRLDKDKSIKCNCPVYTYHFFYNLKGIRAKKNIWNDVRMVIESYSI